MNTKATRIKTLLPLSCCVLLLLLTILLPPAASADYLHAEPSVELFNQTAELTIALDVVPDSTTDVQFGGVFGAIVLDDDTGLSTGDALYENTYTGSIPAGSVSAVTIAVPTGYFLTSITCNSPRALAESPFFRIRANPLAGESITCSFVLSAAGQVSVIKFNDNDANGLLNPGETLLSGWRFYALTGVSFNPLAESVTNFGGVALFENIEPLTQRKICEDLGTLSTFANTNPGSRDTVYNLPCKAMTLAPAEWRTVLFGNVDTTGNDADGDRIADTVDNCRFRANPTQIDANHNGVGDACESSLTFVLEVEPARATNFIFNGTLSYFMLDDDDDPELPNTRSFGIETGSPLGSVVTTQSQALYTQFRLEQIECNPAALVDVDVATGTIAVEPTVPGQSITCAFRNIRNTMREVIATPGEVTFEIARVLEHAADPSAVFSWRITNSSAVEKVEIFFAAEADGPYLPLFLDMPVEASGRAVFEGLPPGVWYYQLVVWLRSGEPYLVEPVPLASGSPTGVSVVARQASHSPVGNAAHPVLLAAVAAVALFGSGTLYALGNRWWRKRSLERR